MEQHGEIELGMFELLLELQESVIPWVGPHSHIPPMLQNMKVARKMRVAVFEFKGQERDVRHMLQKDEGREKLSSLMRAVMVSEKDLTKDSWAGESLSVLLDDAKALVERAASTLVQDAANALTESHNAARKLAGGLEGGKLWHEGLTEESSYKDIVEKGQVLVHGPLRPLEGRS